MKPESDGDYNPRCDGSRNNNPSQTAITPLQQAIAGPGAATTASSSVAPLLSENCHNLLLSLLIRALLGARDQGTCRIQTNAVLHHPYTYVGCWNLLTANGTIGLSSSTRKGQ